MGACNSQQKHNKNNQIINNNENVVDNNNNINNNVQTNQEIDMEHLETLRKFPPMFKAKLFNKMTNIIKMRQNFINKPFQSYNYFAKKVTKYFNDQKPPVDTSKKFVDDMFPPNNLSVFSKNEDGTYNDIISTRVERGKNEFNVVEDEVIWLSAEEIFGGKFYLFEDNIECDDVKQGNISDCYFLSSIAAITEFPELIVQIFRQFEVTKNGYYEVVLRINAEWQVVILDDYFPCYKNTKKPVFCRPNGNELWVMLLEKAWAKVNGGYFNINLGYATEPLSSLTNFPSEMFYPIQQYHPEYVWDKIKTAEDSNDLMATGTIKDEKVSEYGLVSGHDFTLISAKEAVINGKRERILKLRNPWGYKEWNGKWSDTSDAWTDEALKAFNIDHLVKDDGCFWMAYEDYLKFYGLLEICYKSKVLCAKSVNINKHKRETPHVFELYIPNKTDVSIQIIKRSYRFNRKIPEDPMQMTNIIIVKKTNDKLEWIEGVGRGFSNPIIKQELNEGRYLIYCYSNFEVHSYDKKRNWKLEVSSNNFFDLNFKSFDDDFSILKCFFQAFIDKDNLCKNKVPFNVLYALSVDKTTFGFAFLMNFSDVNYNIAGNVDLKNMFLLSNNESEKFSQILPAGNAECFILLNKEAGLSTDVNLLNFQYSESSETNFENRQANALKQILVNIPIQSEDYFSDDYYSWTHKLFHLDMKLLNEPINNNMITLKVLQNKYPDVVEKLSQFKEQLLNSQNVLKDLYESEDGSKYIGQWKFDNPEIKEGIGYFEFKPGHYFCGNIQNNEFEGLGFIGFENGSILEATFKNGKIHGEGVLKSYGFSQKCEYSDGEFSKWID